MSFLYMGVAVSGGDLLVLTFEELNGEESEMLWRVPKTYTRDRFWDSNAGEGDYRGLNVSNWRLSPTRIRHAAEHEDFTDLTHRQPLAAGQFGIGDSLLLVSRPEHKVAPNDLDELFDGDKRLAQKFAKSFTEDYYDWWEMRLTLREENDAWFDDEPDTIYSRAREFVLDEGEDDGYEEIPRPIIAYHA